MRLPQIQIGSLVTVVGRVWLLLCSRVLETDKDKAYFPVICFVKTKSLYLRSVCTVLEERIPVSISLQRFSRLENFPNIEHIFCDHIHWHVSSWSCVWYHSWLYAFPGFISIDDLAPGGLRRKFPDDFRPHWYPSNRLQVIRNPRRSMVASARELVTVQRIYSISCVHSFITLTRRQQHQIKVFSPILIAVGDTRGEQSRVTLKLYDPSPLVGQPYTSQARDR